MSAPTETQPLPPTACGRISFGCSSMKNGVAVSSARRNPAQTRSVIAAIVRRRSMGVSGLPLEVMGDLLAGLAGVVDDDAVAFEVAALIQRVACQLEAVDLAVRELHRQDLVDAIDCGDDALGLREAAERV